MGLMEGLTEERLASLCCDVFQIEFVKTPAPARGELIQDGTVTLYRFQGAQNGTIAVLYPASDRMPLVDRFLKQTLGVSVDAVDGGEDGVCLEITNIILGHLAGEASEAGDLVEISDPGVAVTAMDFAEETPAFLDGEGMLTATGPADGSKGVLTAWIQTDDKPAEAEPAGKPKVLIVDDSPVMCAFLQKIFTEYGYEVAGVAGDGVEAIEKFEETQPDLVTLDIIMPKMKGTEVLERILAKKPDAKVVMASSVSDARTVMKCLKVGAKRYIIKPYDREAVIEAVEKAMGLPGKEG